jgi:hypothetical protein
MDSGSTARVKCVKVASCFVSLKCIGQRVITNDSRSRLLHDDEDTYLLLPGRTRCMLNLVLIKSTI